MNKNTKYYVLTAAIAMLGAVSCDKSGNDTALTADSSAITFSASLPQTKAILHADNWMNSCELAIYDYLDGNTESYNDRVYINSTIKYWPNTPNNPWPVEGAPEKGYVWFENTLKRPDHNFFSWIQRDGDLTPASIFGKDLSVSVSNGVYTVATPSEGASIKLESSQFDFCYSDMIQRKAAKADYSTVGIQLQHFLTSFGVKAHNYSEDDITIKSVKLYGLTTRKSGSITYNIPAGTTSVSYVAKGQDWTSSSPLELLASNITIKAGEDIPNIITCSGKATNATEPFFLMWPQTNEELKNAYIKVVYSVAGGSDETPEARALCLSAEKLVWEAGVRQQLEVSFAKKSLTLTAHKVPWDFYEPVIDYSAMVSVKDKGMLTFDKVTCNIDEENRRVYFKNGNPIKATFTIDGPLEATWLISKVGDWDAFELDNATPYPYPSGEPVSLFGDGVDYSYGQIQLLDPADVSKGGATATITIYPKIIDPDKDYEMTLSFAIRTASGKVQSIDREIQGEDKSKYYKIILQAS